MATSIQHFQQTTSSQTITTTTETVIETSDFLSLAPVGGEGYKVNGLVNITTGAGTTALVLRVRQNSLTGTVVGNALTVAAAASTAVSVTYEAGDIAAASSPVGSYVVTVTQTGATGNGTVNYVSMGVCPVSSAS